MVTCIFYAVTMARKLVSTVRGTVDCRRLDGGNTIIFAKQKCKRASSPAPLQKDLWEIATPVCAVVRNDGRTFCEAKMQTSLVTASVQALYRLFCPEGQNAPIMPHILFQSAPNLLGLASVMFYARITYPSITSSSIMTAKPRTIPVVAE